MTNTDYYRAVVFGAVIGMSFLTLFYMINTAVDNKPQPQAQTNFQVIDHYKGCDLLQWSSSQLAEYKYVLYCPK